MLKNKNVGKYFFLFIVWELVYSRGNFVMKVSRWSSCVKTVLKNMKNIVGNFVTCTDGLYRPFKNWRLWFSMKTRLGH